MVRQAVGSHDRKKVQEALALCHNLEQMDDNRHMLFAPPAVFETVAWCHDFQKYRGKQNDLDAELINNYKIFLEFVKKFKQLEQEGKTDGLSLKEFLLRKDYRGFNLLCVPVFTRNRGLLRCLLGSYWEVFEEEEVTEIVQEIAAMELIGEQESEVLIEQLDTRKEWMGGLTVEMIPEPTTHWEVEATDEERAASAEMKKRRPKTQKAQKHPTKADATKKPRAISKKAKAAATRKAKSRVAEAEANTAAKEAAEVKLAEARKSRAERAARRQSVVQVN